MKTHRAQLEVDCDLGSRRLMLNVGIEHQHRPPTFFELGEIPMVCFIILSCCMREDTNYVRLILARHVCISSPLINLIPGRPTMAGMEVMQGWREEFQCS